MLWGVIGKHIKNKALDAVGLGSFLGEQKKSLGFMPASLTEGLGFGNLLGNVTGAAGNVAGAVSGAAGNAANAVSGAAGNAAGAVSGAAGKVGGAVSGVAGNAAGAVSGAAGSAGDAAKQAAGGAGGFLKLLFPLLLLGALAYGVYSFWPMLTGAAGAAGDAAKKGAGAMVDGAGDMAKGAGDMAKGAMGGMSIPGMDFGSIEGFDMESLGATGPALTKGFGDITSGFTGLATSGEDGARDLAGKITGFSDSIGGMGLDKLTGAGKTSATGMIGMFIEKIKSLFVGQSEGIQGILKPSVDGLMEKLSPFTG